MKLISALLLCGVLTGQTVQAEPIPSGEDSLTSFLDEQGIAWRDRNPYSLDGPSVSPSTDSGSVIVMNAMGYLGTPYRYGGNDASSGFDCSGFVKAVVGDSIGLHLPRRSDQQSALGHDVDEEGLRPGDLVFFNTQRRPFSHVGIYIGEGRFVHAPRTGTRIRVESMQASYWQTRFNGARRLTLEESASLPAKTSTAYRSMSTLRPDPFDTTYYGN